MLNVGYLVFYSSYCIFDCCVLIGSKWLNPSPSSNQLWTWGVEDDAQNAKIGGKNNSTRRIDEAEQLVSQEAISLSKDAAGVEVTACQQSNMGDPQPVKEGGGELLNNELNLQQLSLLDVSLEDICPGPARGEMYGYQCNDVSDTDSYYSLSLDEGDDGSTTDAENGQDGRTSNGKYHEFVLFYIP